MTSTVIFDPLLPWPLLAGLGAVMLAFIGLALWRGLRGWPLRGLAAVVVLGALTGPSLRQEDRAPLSDIVLLVEDRSASQQLSDRAQQTEAAAERLAAEIAAEPNTEVRRVTLGDGAGDSGTQLMTALSEAMAEEPRGRIAGAILLSDGRLHDLDRAPDMPAPLHLLLTGQPEDWDRRLIVRNAPAFAILGEPVTLTLRIEDSGAAPEGNGEAPLDISVDGAEPERFMVQTGRDIELPITLPHGGRNVIQFSVPAEDGELTDRNNTALVQMNGVRDRLRVLLVSGEPHAGGRTWRNLLKSDSSVDLVHFTILRPPAKQDGVPVSELSLIAFPTRELFLEKIEDFDLIIFDRYKRRGILPALYLDNVRQYVEDGGALLINAGPDFASADSLYRSPLSEVLPGRPTARVIEEGYRPHVTDLGERHPVTAGLTRGWQGDWGRWLRQIELEPERGSTVMAGAEEKPLLILDRVGEGRVALLASDQAWLWNRGFEGGGPQLELLRRLAHWMMKEPELEEEALTAEATGQQMRIIRRTLGEEVGPLTITTPSGEEVELPMQDVAPGQFTAEYTGPEIGLYRLANDDQSAVIGLGPAAPREFEQTIADGAALEPLVDGTRGGIMALSDGVPAVRDVRAGRPAAGRGWIGFTPRNAYETQDVRLIPLLPAWLVLLLAAGLILAAWLREGRR
ncbi:glutamine amidotransferase [Maritimibacter alkaliphilus]|uniref:glutamine amidotransferase n=1 Tax=Maritimibacter alkaliphilus TaxID=404236 RepID=UPI001C945923|nr:glutamine amidotransferase [Maritimibacter alkaliphilus]MBY6090774.1 glutamine amidotransferase [Maritimibacter alkaliphilus]